MTFRGTFDLTLDAKNRLTVPTRYRAAYAEGVVLAAGLEDCVAIWRPEDYDAWTAGALAGHSPLSPEFRKLNRYFAANSHPIELDGAGRFHFVTLSPGLGTLRGMVGRWRAGAHGPRMPVLLGRKLPRPGE